MNKETPTPDPKDRTKYHPKVQYLDKKLAQPKHNPDSSYLGLNEPLSKNGSKSR